MARAGYCSQCGENVYLNPDGSCPKGHGADCVSNPYEVPDAPAPAPVPAPAPAPQGGYQPPTQPAPGYQPPPAYAPPTPVTSAAPPAYAPAPPKKKRTGLTIALVILGLLLLCCCGGFAGFYFIGKNAESSTGTSSGTPAKADPEKAKTAAAWAFVKATMLGDAEGVKASVPADTVGAVAPEFWTSFAESSKSDDATVQNETWDGAVLKVDVKDGNGVGSITLTPSKPDAEHVEVSLALAGREATIAGAKVQQIDGGWKVVEFGTSDLKVPFDKDGLLKFISEQ